MGIVTVKKPGMLTTVQDMGRDAYRSFGVSVSGAMDLFSLRLANILVGNAEDEAALEVTLIGPRLQFKSATVFALTGGDLSPQLNNKPIPMWTSIRVKSGDELHFGKYGSGCRVYISFAGGIDVPKVMESKSTFIRGEYGGIEGRPLQADDELRIGKSRFHINDLYGRKIRSNDIPEFDNNRPIRFILGPHHESFSKTSFERFIKTAYTVSTDSDRMGYRLTGEPLKHISKADIISDFITVGTIQVPGNGQPIVHMADCGTSGGYTKMGVIIGVDIPYVAQKKPGDCIKFEETTIEDAQHAFRKQEQLIKAIGFNNDLID